MRLLSISKDFKRKMTWPENGEKPKKKKNNFVEKCFDEDVAVLSDGHLSAIAATTTTRPTTMATDTSNNKACN